MLIGGPFMGGDRHELQTQFPASGIELRGCNQTVLRSLHLTNIPNACARSVAGIDPGSTRHRGRKRDYRANEGAERGKPEICLHAIYLKHSEIDISNFL